MDKVEIRIRFEDCSLGAAPGVHVFFTIGCIYPFQFLAVRHDLSPPFENDYIVPIARVDNDPRLVRQVPGFLQSAG
jgi:hypothetical protein